MIYSFTKTCLIISPLLKLLISPFFPPLYIPQRRHVHTVDGSNHRHIICAFKWLHLKEVILVSCYFLSPNLETSETVNTVTSFTKTGANRRVWGVVKNVFPFTWVAFWWKHSFVVWGLKIKGATSKSMRSLRTKPIIDMVLIRRLGKPKNNHTKKAAYGETDVAVSWRGSFCLSGCDLCVIACAGWGSWEIY